MFRKSQFIAFSDALSFLFVQVRMRDTFMKVGQSLMVKKQLVNEKGLKEKMIHSVMPPKVRQIKHLS